MHNWQSGIVLVLALILTGCNNSNIRRYEEVGYINKDGTYYKMVPNTNSTHQRKKATGSSRPTTTRGFK